MLSLTAIRDGLRSLRQREDFTLDDLAKASGVDRAVIHRIENTRKYPDYEPGIETVRRIVEGAGLSLSQFFNDVERQSEQPPRSQYSGLHSHEGIPDNQRTPPHNAELTDGRLISETSIGVEVLLAGLSEAIASAADRVVDRLEQIANPRRPKTRRREGSSARRSKAS